MILNLAENIKIEFAQRPGYFDGMLGIADTLLDVYSLSEDEKYLIYIERLLLNSLYYLEYDKVPQDEFLYVYKRFILKRREKCN